MFAESNAQARFGEVYKYRNDDMAQDWRENAVKSFELCKVRVTHNPYGNYLINGQIKAALAKLSMDRDVYVKFWAPNAATRGQSRSGSGLPYPNEKIAYAGTTNLGAVPIVDGQFSFSLECPNAYYCKMGTQYVEPEVKFSFCDGNNRSISKTYTVVLSKKTQGPDFYFRGRPYISQEEILRRSAQL